MLWPSDGALHPFQSQDEIQAFSRLVGARLHATDHDTDLPGALTQGFQDRARLASDSPAIFWFLTDNWHDMPGGGEAGSGSEGSRRFYQILASPVVRAVSILPLLRNSAGAEGNLVLYEILLADPKSDSLAPADRDVRMESVAAGARRLAYIEDSLVPIVCKGVVLRSPRLASDATFDPEGSCQCLFSQNGDALEFSALKLGVPLVGRLDFSFQSTMREWRIQNAAVDPVLFTFDNGQSGLAPAVPARVPVTPPVLDTLGPGQRSRTRFHLVFPSEGLLCPVLESRSLRQYFPGSSLEMEGTARVGVNVSLGGNNLQLASASLAGLIGRIRLIEGIQLLVASGSVDGHTLRLTKAFPTRYEIEVDDALTWVGPVLTVLLGLGLGILAWLFLGRVSVIYRVDSCEERTVEISAVHGVMVKSGDTTCGILKVRLLEGPAFYPAVSGVGIKPSARIRVRRQEQETVVVVKDVEYRVSMRLA